MIVFPVSCVGSSGGDEFAFDLTTLALPSGLTAARTGNTIYAARSASTVVAVTGADVYEDRGDGRGGGHWVFDGYANSCPPFNFATSPWTDDGSGIVVLGSIGLGPDGATQGSRITDPNTGQCYLKVLDFSITNDKHTHGSLWVRNSAVNPTAAGAIAVGGTTYGVAFGNSATWHRISAFWTKSSGLEYGTQLKIFPAGATPDLRSLGGAITLSATPTGAIEVWGAQDTLAGGDVPLVNGSTGKLDITVDSPAGALSANGDLHIEGAVLWQATRFTDFETPAWTSGDQYLFSAETANGRQSIRWTSDSYFKAQKGDGNSTTGIYLANILAYNQEVRWEYWNRPTAGGGGFNVWFNGCRQGSQTNATRWTAVPQATPTSLYLGSNVGAANSYIPAPVTMLKRADSAISGRRQTTDPEACEGVILGDSILAPLMQAGFLTGSYIYTFAEARSRLGIVSMAVPGDTISNQLSAWQTGAQRGRSDVAWVFIQIGTNDIVAGSSAATISAGITAMIADINTHNPSATVLLSPITPEKGALTGGQYTIWGVVNSDIAGSGPNPVTGSNLVVLDPWTEMNDGSGNLKTQYAEPFTDGVHPNDLGRIYQASVIRTALVNNGLL